MPTSLSHLILAALTASTIPVSATPILDNLRALDFHQLLGRQSCPVPCGGETATYCCQTGQQCYTNPDGSGSCQNVQGSSGSGSAGYWSTYTYTTVRTDLETYTTIGSTYVGAPTWAPATTTYVATSVAPAATGGTVQCNYAMNEKDCGGYLCCASDQYCCSPGQCCPAANPGSSGYASSFTATYTTTMANGQTTVGFLPPLRPTANTLTTRTVAGASATATATTTTVGYVAPVLAGSNVTLSRTSASSGGGLSGGAIAGIVIGVLLALALLFLICFCCCLKAGFDGLMALFGLGKKKRTRETEYIEERRSSRRTGGVRDDRSYYSDERPTRIERRVEEKRSGGIGREMLGIGAGLGGLAAILGLKRERDRKKERRDEKSYYTASSRTGTLSTTESSVSSYIPPARTRSRSRTVRSVSRR